MPLTPFVGLSVLIHAGIITVNRILYKFKTPSRVIADGTSKIARAFAFFIIVGVFSVVTTNAFFLIKASIDDSHSVFVLTEKYINKLDTVRTVTPPLTFQASQLARVTYNFTTETCPQQFKNLSKIYDGSLVVYLKAKNMPTSYYDRAMLAYRYGIGAYFGEIEQNLLIFAKIARENGDLPELGSMACS